MAGRTWKGIPLAPKVVVPPPTIDFVSGGEGAGVSLTVTGLGSLEQLLLSAPKATRVAAGVEMANILADVITLARDGNYIPFDTGALFDSGMSDEYDPATDADISELAAWFGAAMSPAQREKAARALQNEGASTKDPSLYAWDQHENMGYDHHGIGGPKFLEIPFTIIEPTIIPRIVEAIGVVFGGVGTFGYISNEGDLERAI